VAKRTYVALVAAALVCGCVACTSTETTNVAPVPTGPEATPPAEPSAQPVVTTMKPTDGSVGGDVIMTGQGLQNITYVCFGGVPGTHLATSSNGKILTIRIPSGFGSVQVSVVARGNRSLEVGAFTYVGTAGSASRPAQSAAVCSGSGP
jgi:hypothetical protein